MSDSKNIDVTFQGPAKHGRTFPHAMLREIYEQPRALLDTISHYMPDGKLNKDAFSTVAEAMGSKQRLVIAASGSSRNAGLVAEIMLEDLAGLAVDVEYASEYCYRSSFTLQDPGVVVVSQSGETADTLAALREAKLRGLVTVADYTIMAPPPWRVKRMLRCPPLRALRKQFPLPRASPLSSPSSIV